MRRTVKQVRKEIKETKRNIDNVNKSFKWTPVMEMDYDLSEILSRFFSTNLYQENKVPRKDRINNFLKAEDDE